MKIKFRLSCSSLRSAVRVCLLLCFTLSMLSTVGCVPGFIRARAQGQLTACKSNLKNLGTAAEMYATDFNGYFPASTAQFTPNYLKYIPTCPAVASDTYSATWVSWHDTAAPAPSPSASPSGKAPGKTASPSARGKTASSSAPAQGASRTPSDAFTIMCGGLHHAEAFHGDKANFPQYSSREGLREP